MKTLINIFSLCLLFSFQLIGQDNVTIVSPKAGEEITKGNKIFLTASFQSTITPGSYSFYVNGEKSYRGS